MTSVSPLPTIFVDQECLNYINIENEIGIDISLDSYPINSYIILSNFEKDATVLCKSIGNQKLKRVFTPPNHDLFGISSRDAKQAAFIDSLLDPDIKITVCKGSAGTGKTTLALAYALEKLFKENKKLYLSKPTHLVGRSRAFGPVPGDVNEKYAPHIASYEMILKKLTGSSEGTYLSLLRDKNRIQFVPVEYTRGNNYEDGIFILDEAQNFDWHELKTIVSRIAESTKLIILGDPEQIDTKFSYEQSGLYKMINSKAYKQCEFSSEIELEKQYRGPIPQLVHDIDMELKKDEK